ncbi:MAG: endonuclease III domain-containing protein, partial [Planctomycetes bacterium]|nr:endonuclease III domain-containing protein [Planctomycetota bacterium]
MSSTLKQVFDRLLDAYGPQHWWPADSPFEVLIGAVLVQNTAWGNAVKAIDRLREADLLEPRALLAVGPEELEELIRPAGYYRVKARRLRNLLELLVEGFDGSLDAMFAVAISELRPALLGVNGVGPETADSILLYAAGLPTFVVDAYTHRVLARHGWIEFDADYHTIQEHFQSSLEPDVPLYNEYHALLVRVGKLHCGKHPKCEGCPLAELLPEGGALEP